MDELQIDQTTLIIDYWWALALPFICMCSLVASGLSLLALHKLRHLNHLYRLLYVKTFVNLAYLSICFWIFLVKCGHLCLPASDSLAWSMATFTIQIYKVYVYGFVGSVLAYSDLLIEIMLSIERFKIMKNRTPFAIRNTPATNVCEPTAVGEKHEKWYSSFGCLTMFVFTASMVIYLPSLFFFELNTVVQSPPLVFPYRVHKVNAKLDANIQMITNVFLRCIPTLVLVVFVNVLNFFYIKRKVNEMFTFRMTNPNTISTRLVRSMDEAKGKFNRMLFYQSLLYTLGNSFLVVSYAIVFLWSDCSKYAICRFLAPINNTLLFTSLGLNYFLWVRYDHRFGEAFVELVAVQPEETLFV